MPIRVTWLGQSGYLLEDGETSIVLDPYFSDSVSSIKPDFRRLLPVNDHYLRHYDLLLLTHGHLDHTDPSTILALMEKNPDLVVAGPRSSHEKLHAHCRPRQFTLLVAAGGIVYGHWQITALPAYHTDRLALGYLVRHHSIRIYFTGDTVLTGQLLEEAPRDVHVMFSCMNGSGNNMNGIDAVRLAKTCMPQMLVPCHYGMFPEHVDIDAFRQAGKEAGLNVQCWEPFVPMNIA